MHFAILFLPPIKRDNPLTVSLPMENTQERDVIAKIIYDGIKAPSGENSQPWRFMVDGAVVFIFNLTERDTTLYNTGQHGSYVAHGALIENMVISASHYGYQAEVVYFPSGGLNPIAKVILTKSEITEDPLYASLSLRSTNRHEYRLNKIPDAHKQSLVEESLKLGTGSLIILDQEAQIKALAKASATVERLMFENKLFHKFFYEHFFTRQQDENKPAGFYIDTLGLSNFERIGTRLTRYWPVAVLVRTLGISRIVVAMRMKHYLKTGAFGAIVSPGDEALNYVQTGRVVERVWIKAAELEISMQPCVGVLYLWEGIMKKVDIFSPKEKRMIEETRNQILEAFGIRGETVPMFFRMGYAVSPATRSFRYEPEINYIS